jgi:hypothetical protein
MVSLGERERKQEKTSVSNAGRKQNAIKSSIITGPRVHGKMETAEGRRGRKKKVEQQKEKRENTMPTNY